MLPGNKLYHLTTDPGGRFGSSPDAEDDWEAKRGVR